MMAGDAPDAPALPKAPEPFKFGSFRDLINNVEVLQKTGADKKEHLVQRKIEPDDPFVKKFLDESKMMIGSLIKDIDEISKENPRLVAPFHGFINTISQLNDEDLADWTQSVTPEDFSALKNRLIDTNKFLNNEEWDTYDHNLELDLGARRLHNSSVANERRALSQRNRAISNDMIRNNAEVLSDQLVNSDLARKQALYQGRQATRMRSADIAAQNLQLEQNQVDKTLMERDDRMNKFMQRLGLRQNAINEQTNLDRGANIAPTVLANQNQVTANQNQAWGTKVSGIMGQHQATMQGYAANQGLLGSLAGGAATIGAAFVAPHLLPVAVAGTAAANAAAAKG